jgi:hypothetical protein
MGLLGNGWEDPQSAAIMALAGGLLQGNFAGGLLGATDAYGAAKMGALKQSLLKAQLDEQQAEAAQKKSTLEQAALLRRELPGLFGGGGWSGGQAVPQSSGGVEMFSQPPGVTPMRQSAAPSFDVQRAIQLGLSPKQIEEYAALTNVGRPKATRQMEVDDGRGGKRLALVDDYGQEVAGFAGYTAPVQVNRGDRVEFVKPAPGVSLGINMSPDARASNALGWANHSLSKQRLAMDASAPKGQVVETPNGFVLVDPREGTSRAITGPDGQALRGKGTDRNLTDAQAKANLFGSRMKESDRILQSLEGKYFPAAVNAKMAAQETPGIGGVAGYVGNLALSKEGQQAEQAQRDFVNAVLRRESGAVISPQEFANAQKQYFPQPGDSKEVLAQKRRNRTIAIEGLMAEVPEGRRGVPSLTNPGNTGGATGGWSIQKVN